MALIKIKYTRENGTTGIKVYSDQPSKTNPNYKDEVDVNNIINRFLQTGNLTHTSNQPMDYIDQSNMQTDLQSALHFIKNQEEIYRTLTKKHKKMFPTIEQFLEFAENPENQEELLKILGLNKNDDSNDENKKPKKDSTTPPPTPPTPPTPSNDSKTKN